MEQEELKQCAEFIYDKSYSKTCPHCNNASDILPYESDVYLKGDKQPLVAVSCPTCGIITFFRVGNR